MVFSTKSLAEAENKEFVQIPTGTHSTKPSHLNHEDLLPNLNDRLQKSIEDLVEIVSEEKTTHQPATTGLYEKFMRENRWYSDNQFRPTPRLLTRENHEIREPFEKYDWAFALGSVCLSILVGVIIIRSYSSPKDESNDDTCSKNSNEKEEHLSPTRPDRR